MKPYTDHKYNRKIELRKPSNKSRTVAFLLAFLLGVFGAHRFYVGKHWTAILQMLTFGGFAIWLTIDIVMILVGTFRDKKGYKVTQWDPEN